MIYIYTVFNINVINVIIITLIDKNSNNIY